MKNTKRTLAVIMALAMIFALCACSSGTSSQSAAEATAEPTATPTPEPEQPNTAALEAQTAELNTLLEGFATGIQAGTAGSSLKAVYQATLLLDWGVSTGMNDEQISSVVSSYLSGMDEQTKSDYLLQIESLDYAYKELLQPDMESLLESAGCADAAYPWSDSPVPAIESLMSAMGMR